MAIYGIGTIRDDADVSRRFIEAHVAGTNWPVTEAPEIHQFLRSLKVGDIVYLKASALRSREIIVKAVGVIIDDVILANRLVRCGRNVRWADTSQFRLPLPSERNNVRRNTIYEEFHPVVQRAIIARIVREHPR